MDIKKIMDQAKEQFLKHKQYAPTFIVERQKDLDVVVLDHLEDTTLDKQKQFFSVARSLAKERQWDVKDVEEIVFIVEMWMSQRVVDEPAKYDRPRDDPNRREALLITKLALKPKPTMTAQIVEILRVGESVDLLPLGEAERIEHNLLSAFLAGIASKDYSEKQLVKMAKKAAKKLR